MSNNVTGFLVTSNNRFELVECNFELEDRFQETIENYIDLLEKLFKTELLNCGKVSFSSGLEPDLILLSRKDYDETSDYIPMIIELKRMDNREVRREVLAQLFEYMTAVYLEPENIIEACQSKGIDFDLDNLRRNIENRRIIGVIISESIPDIVKKTIEFANEELSNPELYGVEFKRLCAVGNPEYSVIIPVVIGATTDAERRKRKTIRVLWTYEKLRQSYNNYDNEILRNRLLDLLEWARNKGLLKEYSSPEPRFKIADIINVNPNGTFYVKFGKNHESKLPKPKRQQLLEGLQELGMLKVDIKDADTVDDGKTTVKSITELSDDQYTKLKSLLEIIFLK